MAEGGAEPRVAAYRQWYLQLVVERLLHDFSNVVGGVLALTEHHLQEGGLESSVQTSLELIRDGGSQGRELLAEVGGLLSEDGAALHRASELCREIAAALRTFLPRRVALEVQAFAGEGVVWASAPDWKRRWLAVAALTLHGDPPHAVHFGCSLAGSACRFTFEPIDGGSGASAALVSAALTPESEPGMSPRARVRPTARAWAVDLELPFVPEASWPRLGGSPAEPRPSPLA